ncbi:serine/threonine protein kinase [Kribbella deserti]|uniref:non-specific serine/threonine protein kinase n=1 Tax=Kribbella deserti TaxID=1926257 RepID=A0ABV6QW66_9ACTN
MRSGESEGRLLAGRYRLLDSLGRGGMGVVWHARDEVLGREVAVKEILLPPELPDEEREVLRHRTLREARSAARLSHPNVVAVYDVVEEEGRPWIVMELVKSRTLADAVRRDGPLPSWQVARIGLQVLAALETAHSAGVLHRDVKPSNVLLADDGRVVLTDFGIATLEGDPSLTQSGTLVGSPAYIAPERVQARGAGPESDLWSLGATLYTAVEGRAPHDRGSALPTLTAAVTEAPDPPELAGPLWPALEGLLRKSPAERLDAPTARHLLQEAATEPKSDTHSVPPPNFEACTALLPSASGDETAPLDGSPGDETAALPAESASETPTSDRGQRTRILPVPPAAPQPQATTPPATSVSPTTPSPATTSPTAPEAASPAAAGAGPALAGSASGRDGGGSALAGPASSGDGDGPAGTKESPGRWGPKALGVLAACVLLIGALTAWTLFNPDDDSPGQRSGVGGTSPTVAPTSGGPSGSGQTSAPQTSRPQSSGPRTSASQSTTPSSPASTAPTSQPTQPTSRPTSTPTNPADAVPAGFKRHSDPTGFSLAVPDDWNVERNGGRVYFREPDGGRFLLIDQTTQPKADPVADWRQQEQSRRDGYPEYQRIRIEAVDYFDKAADWEFTYAGRNGRQHVLNRGVVTGPRRAYSIYWSTPNRQWDDSQETFRTITSTFQPAS